MADRPKADPEWTEFLIAYGYRASRYHLAAVLGRSEEEVTTVRNSGVCRRLPAGLGFTALFSLWNGRPPAESDWPPPRNTGGNGYEWHDPESALLASLVGQLSTVDIANALTLRLRQLTGDASAERTVAPVTGQMQAIGLQSRDVLGGITLSDAGREVGDLALVRHAVTTGDLRTSSVGRLMMIPHAAWVEWKSRRVGPQEGFVALASLRERLTIKIDKLAEFAKMGYIPGATLCQPHGVKANTGKMGAWYISATAGDALVTDRVAGKPMPWHGKSTSDNLRASFKLWQIWQHSHTCNTCTHIWGATGPADTFADFQVRYPSIAHGAKRHLTMIWSPGLTLQEVAARSARHHLCGTRNQKWHAACGRDR